MLRTVGCKCMADLRLDDMQSNILGRQYQGLKDCHLQNTIYIFIIITYIQQQSNENIMEQNPALLFASVAVLTHKLWSY